VVDLLVDPGQLGPHPILVEFDGDLDRVDVAGDLGQRLVESLAVDLDGDLDLVGARAPGGPVDVVLDVLQVEADRDPDLVEPQLIELAVQVVLVEVEPDRDLDPVVADLPELALQIPLEIVRIRDDSGNRTDTRATSSPPGPVIGPDHLDPGLAWRGVPPLDQFGHLRHDPRLDLAFRRLDQRPDLLAGPLAVRVVQQVHRGGEQRVLQAPRPELRAAAHARGERRGVVELPDEQKDVAGRQTAAYTVLARPPEIADVDPDPGQVVGQRRAVLVDQLAELVASPGWLTFM
jgi:hypothetical protein